MEIETKYEICCERLNQKNKTQLKILRKFLIEQVCVNSSSEDLASVLSSMSINTFVGGIPACISIWHDWKECWKFYTHVFEKKYDEQVVAQAFMAAFRLLDENFWKKDNEVTIGFVLGAIDDCLVDISNNKENELWTLWAKYLEKEKGQRYRFAESIVLPIIVERQFEGVKYYNFIEDALSFMSLQDIKKGLYQAFDAEGKSLKIEVKCNSFQTFFLLRLLLYIFNALTFSTVKKTYYVEVNLPRTYQDKKEYLELALFEYLKKYQLSISNKSLPILISVLKEIN